MGQHKTNQEALSKEECERLLGLLRDEILKMCNLPNTEYFTRDHLNKENKNED